MNPIIKAWKNLFDRVAAKKAAKERHEASVRGSILISLPPESIFIPRFKRRRLEFAKSQVRHQRRRCARVRRYQNVTLRVHKTLAVGVTTTRPRDAAGAAAWDKRMADAVRRVVNDPVIGGALARMA